MSRFREAVFKPAPANANYDWTDQWNRTYDAMGDSSIKNQKLNVLLASFDHHLTKGNNFTVVDMTGYPMEWRIAMAKRADASGRKDVIRIGF
ncbi:hypothetical protein [Micromonospora lupini]|uniref:hypothetical protein n=1 Tax=Micromonospora lupini TaxID=285679 RepID=UPI001181C4DD|nr:hypothetical protein [Micromonospora lupini]